MLVKVSIIGNPSAIIATINITDVVVFKAPHTAISASMNPKSSAPESPRYIFAGGKLKIKKPRLMPDIEKQIVATKN